MPKDLDQIKYALQQGYYIAGTLENVGDDFMRTKGIPNHIIAQHPHLVIIEHSKTRKGGLIPYKSEESITFIAAQLEKENMPLYYSEVSYRVTQIGHASLTSYCDNKPIIESLKDIFPIDSDYIVLDNKSFQITLKKSIKTIEEIQALRGQLQEVLSVLAVVNEIGFVIYHMDYLPKYRNRIGVKMTGVQKATRLINKEGYRKIYSLTTKSGVLHHINEYYSQNSESDKLTILWGIIEKLFYTDPPQLFNGDEKKALIDHIEQIRFISGSQKSKLIEHINFGLLKSKSRNEVIAENISEIMGDDYASTLGEVRNLARERGKRSHTLKELSPNREVFKYFEKVISKYLEQKL